MLSSSLDLLVQIAKASLQWSHLSTKEVVKIYCFQFVSFISMDGLYSQVYFSVRRQSLQKGNSQLILLRGHLLLGLGEFIYYFFFCLTQLVFEKIFGVIYTSVSDSKKKNCFPELLGSWSMLYAKVFSSTDYSLLYNPLIMVAKHVLV